MTRRNDPPSSPAKGRTATTGLGRLTLCGASAGTGKTYSICELIAEKVARDGLDPARLIATTFTIKAAAELKGRIAARLLEDELDPARAERLELAPIGTVHSVAYQLLTRYALHLGLSPRLSVADEVASERLLRLALQRLERDPWDRLSEVAERLGQDDLDMTLLALIQEKRISAIDDTTFREQMGENAEQFVAILLAGGSPQPAGDTPALRRAQAIAEQALDRLAVLVCGTKKTQDARKRLREISGGASVSWRDVVRLGRIEAAKRSGANQHLHAAREFGSGARTFVELHADIRQYMSLLTEQTIALERTYLAYKTERGLLDFTDLEVEFLRLLRGDLAEELAADFDLVVVDEFQDTNPLQLAIFTRLRQLTPESYWVGDEKQSIFGFRGTDARLMHEVWLRSDPDERRVLETNYRSRPGLVDFVNRVFVPIFGEDAKLSPHRDPAMSGLAGIGRWILSAGSNEEEANAIALGIARLHRDDGTPLADIAALVRTNEQGKQLGAALTRLGLPCVIELPGLLLTRECTVAVAGLRLVADRRDSLAAATLLHLLVEPSSSETPSWFAERLREVRADEAAAGEARARWGASGDTTASSHMAFRRTRSTDSAARTIPWSGHPSLAAIDELGRRSATLTPSETLSAVIGALEVPQRAAQWSTPAMRCGHLDALLKHARNYEQEALDSGRPATLTGLIGYFERLVEEDKDLRYPPVGLDAVTVATYHLSKGLEWPTVVLTGLDHQRAPDLFRPSTSGGDPAASDPLRGRRIHYWPWPFGRSSHGQLTPGSQLENDCRTTPEGEATMVAEREESVRLLYVGFTRARDRLILAHRQGKHAWLDELPSLSGTLGRNLALGTHEIEGVSTTIRIELFGAESADSYSPGPGTAVPPSDEERVHWLNPRCVPEGEQSTRLAYVSPSGQRAADPRGTRFDIVDLPGIAPSLASARIPAGDESRFGNAVHAYLASLPSLRRLDSSRRETVARRCLVAHACEHLLEPTALAAAGDRFMAWLNDRSPTAVCFPETYVTAPHASEARVVGKEDPTARWGLPQTWGTIDLLVVHAGGENVGTAEVIDHKTGAPGRSGLHVYAAQYTGQLDAYREVLHAAGIEAKPWLHLPLGEGVLIGVRRVD